MSQVRWLELTESQRSKEDNLQSDLVNKIYNEGKISHHDILKFKQLSSSDFTSPQSPWLTASIIVSTNRERFTLTHLAACRFAIAEKTFVYRWPTRIKQWEGVPFDNPEVYDDPCLYKYFVEGAPGFITDRICSDLNLVNAMPIIYQSLVIENKEDIATIALVESLADLEQSSL